MSKLSQMAAEIRSLRAQVQSLKPIRTDGVLTSRSSRGTSSKPTPKPYQSTNNNYIPRWG